MQYLIFLFFNADDIIFKPDFHHLDQGWATSQINSLILLKKKTIFSQNHQIKSVL